jgi:hypothetical protein
MTAIQFCPIFWFCEAKVSSNRPPSKRCLIDQICGFVAEPAVKLIKMLAERIAEKTNCPYSVVVNYWYIRISTSLQKGNAKIIKIIDDQLKSGRTVVLSDDD